MGDGTLAGQKMADGECQCCAVFTQNINQTSICGSHGHGTYHELYSRSLSTFPICSF